ncbi:hypothetical protein [Bdellovibrio svalbardensis]|uniref:Lipocalin-like domain-containing protein n=1 Tax=Bdellovibrio svalbardensis TaxID=2972972 RepID=A0ABT6DI29_9BACT|nr:hypothetical protein [Bdellovibrio svalbardensis]MDG0814758.1 hypothetical protein [Bdellovibrio svalbardensis]
MKKTKLVLMCAGILFSLKGVAAEQTQVMKGIGIDGKACAVKIVREGDLLKSVILEGASQVFEIIAEKSDGYGPRTEIREKGGGEVLGIAEESKGMYSYFTHSENIFSNGETFKLDTNDLPQTGESLKGLKMIIQIGLRYDGNELVSVKAQNKAKALLVATLASAQFTCQK